MARGSTTIALAVMAFACFVAAEASTRHLLQSRELPMLGHHSPSHSPSCN